MKISLVAAVAQNGIIGKKNDLPWRLPDDMKFFMETTKGHVVILGRKNYESLPPKFQPLPGRTNIIVSRQENYEAPGSFVVNSIKKALEIAIESGETEAMVIGGSEIYALSLEYADRLYITEVLADVDGDVSFPPYNKKEWKEISRLHHEADQRHVYAFDFVVYERIEENLKYGDIDK
nr:Dihydrofolate reductase [uncultured bacterium]AIA14246.1 Dihydrofolate reductase [uncultured bacterium]